MRDRLFEAALGIAPPWCVPGVRFDEASEVLTVGVEVSAGSRFAVDAAARQVLGVTEGRDAKAAKTVAEELAEHGCPPERIESVSIGMSPAFIKGCTEELPNARSTFDGFHVVWHAYAAVDKMRRIEQRSDKFLKGMRCSPLKDRAYLKPDGRR